MPSPRFTSDPVDPAPLGEPLKFEFSGRTAPNRFLNAAMSERLASFDPDDVASRGIPKPEAVTLYKKWGEGGWGQIQTGNIMIDGNHLEAAGNFVIPIGAPFSGPRFEGFKAIAKAGSAHGSLMIPQVGHPGRQVMKSIQKEPISASDVQLGASIFNTEFAKPRPATEEDIRRVVKGFAHVAEYLEKAGFDGLELHAAHGYLLAQFLSPQTNLRTDKYGGSLENRARIVLEVAAAIRARTSPSFILGAKINALEQTENGVQPEDARDLAVLLEKATFDFLELSGGNYEKFGLKMATPEQRKREGYYVDVAAIVGKPLTKTKLYTTGGFKTAAAMVAALRTVDGVGLARPAAQEPNLANDILSGKVTGIIKYAIDDDDLTTRLNSAFALIKQIARGEEPDDLSDPKVVEKLVGKAI